MIYKLLIKHWIAHVVDLIYAQILAKSSSNNETSPKPSSPVVENISPTQSNARLLQRNFRSVINLDFTLGFVHIALDGKKPVLPAWQKIKK